MMTNDDLDIHGLPEHALREKRFVAMSSLVAATALTAMKLVVGIATNSLGILSEAAHSALDLVAAGITFWAVRVSGKPADSRHTYGHGKFENLSALVETLLLLATCVWIIYEAVGRLFFKQHEPVDANLWAFGVILVSIVIDVSRSRALLRVARKYDSQALEADALHFSTDVWSSLVVLFGLAGVRLSESALGWKWLEKADSVAALGVAMIVVYVSVQLGKKCVADLLDAVPDGLRRDVETAVREIEGVDGVGRIRLRRSGADYFADVTVAVDHARPFAQTHEIADRVEAGIRKILPKADVVVHVEPEAPDGEALPTTIRVLAARRHLGAHSIRVYDEEGARSVELHLEVCESLTLDEAHAEVSAFEGELREAVAGLKRIVTHIEPIGTDGEGIAAVPVGRGEVARVLREFAAEHGAALKVHDIEVQRAGDKLAVSCHCTLDAGMTVTEAHEVTQRMETYLRSAVDQIDRVVIHVEPPGATQ